jgi:hypothetical protein
MPDMPEAAEFLTEPEKADHQGRGFGPAFLLGKWPNQQPKVGNWVGNWKLRKKIRA